MATPIKVGNSGDSQDSSSFCGPFSFGGALYVFADMMTQHQTMVYKSVDNGTTWTGPLDSFNAPLFPVASQGKAPAYDIVPEVVSGKLVVSYIDSGFSQLAIKQFDLTSLTWGAAILCGFNATSGTDTTQDPRVRIVRMTSGDLRVFFTEWLTTNQTVNYADFNGVSWGANTVMVPSSGTIFNYPGAAFQDSNGLLHVFYRKSPTEGTAAALYHRTLTTGGAVGAENLIDATTTDIPFGRSFEFDGLPNVIHYDSNSRTGVWTGDSLTSPTPSWTFELLNDLAWPPGVHDIGPQQPEAGSPEYGAKGFAFISGGVAYVIWQSTSDDGSGTDFSTNAVYMATNTGSGWSDPVLLYDNVVDPVPVAGTDKIFALSAGVVDGNLYAFADVNCRGLFLVALQPAVATDPAIECPGIQTVSVGDKLTIDFSAVTSGGTPPYSWAITVGSLPPGVVLNQTTGIATGIVTAAGQYSFTVTVTDENDNTASATCGANILPRQYFFGNAEQLVCDVNYPWLIPPSLRIPWSERFSIQAPAIGTITLIWEYPIPDNFYLIVDRIMHAYGPGLFIEGSGAIIWTIDINFPVGAPLVNWRPVSQFVGSVGSFEKPWPVGPLQFRGNDVLRYKVEITDPTVPTGPPNVITAMAEGWLYPVPRNVL